MIQIQNSDKDLGYCENRRRVLAEIDIHKLLKIENSYLLFVKYRDARSVAEIVKDLVDSYLLIIDEASLKRLIEIESDGKDNDLDHRVKSIISKIRHDFSSDNEYYKQYCALLNRLTYKFTKLFCDQGGFILWVKLTKFIFEENSKSE
ncbi:MAG: hypothetical protein K9N06_00215 [Candidatus Cloacimonetes bacterium]|nr:hypothetical protein [Candidatus Cloacimonadota bacterium]